MSESLQNALDTGSRLLAARRIDDANRLAQSLRQHFPGHSQVLLFSADAAIAAGTHDAALAHLQALPAEEQRAAPAQLRLAQSLFARRRRGEAREAAHAAAACVEDDVWQLGTLARILMDCQDPQAARHWLEHAHQRFPSDAKILFDLAVAEFHSNLVDEAEQHVQELLRSHPLHPGALHLRSALRTMGPERNNLAELEICSAREPGNARLQAACGFALAKEYEDLQRYDLSWEALLEGARACRSTLGYDLRDEIASLEAVRGAFTAQPPGGSGFEEFAPVFVIGMPRTGTTLVEQMLAGHSSVRSVGELPDFPALLGEVLQETMAGAGPGANAAEASLRMDFRELGRRYAHSAQQLAGECERTVDKLPYNFQYCGYILAALPNARLIHLRRDPLDTCYAVFKTLFFGAYSWSYDLAELAEYYVAYRRQMEHWHRILPGQILDVHYEELVHDTETQARRILQWCGLEWEDAVLDYRDAGRAVMTASAMQIRRPMYSDSIGAWRRAGPEFRIVQERLATAGLLDPGSGD